MQGRKSRARWRSQSLVPEFDAVVARRAEHGREARQRLMMCAALALGAGPSYAHAQTFESGLSIVSDSVWRGYSKSQGRATAALDLAWRLDSGWFAAAGVLDRRAGASAGRYEITTALGRVWIAEPDWALSASAARYTRLGGESRGNGDYTDLSLSLDWRGQWLATFTASPDTRRGTRSGWTSNVELGWHQRLSHGLAADVGAGWQDNHGIGGRSYGYGNVGLSWSLGPARLAASRVTSAAVRSGALPASAQASRWVVSLLITH